MKRSKTKDVTIEGELYRLELLGAIEGRDVGVALLQTLAPAVRGLANVNIAEQETAMLVGIAELVAHLDAKMLGHLCASFGRKSRVVVTHPSGEVAEPLISDIFDEHFAGRYGTMSKWLGECVVFNFAGPLADGKLGSMLATFRAAASKFKFPTGSTGSSGESSPTSETEQRSTK